MAKKESKKVIKHKVKKKDLEINPELKEAGVKVGEVVELPVEEKKEIYKTYREKKIVSEKDVIKGEQKLKQIVDEFGTTFLITQEEYDLEVEEA